MLVHLHHRQDEVPGVASFFFESEEPVTWQAGQFGVYYLDHPNFDKEGPERYFTISNAPHEKLLRITTRITQSTFKQALNRMAEGDPIELKDVSGEFVLPQQPDRVVMIAGGIGITPFRSMLGDLAYRQQSIQVRLVYANRDNQLVFGDELEDLARQHEGLTIEPVIDPARIDGEMVKSLVQEEPESLFYISGPQPMVVAVSKGFVDAGVASERMKRDYFPGYTWPE
jgi:ferredoxin-NADP reductase